MVDPESGGAEAVVENEGSGGEAEKNPVGRPPFKPTAALKKRVSQGKAMGMSHDQLASALSISRPTLEKHFAMELGEGASKRRLEIVEALFKSAKNGNVAAQRTILSMAPASSKPAASDPDVPEQPKETKLRPVLMGKKEQAQQAAENAERDTEWDGLLNPSGPAH